MNHCIVGGMNVPNNIYCSFLKQWKYSQNGLPAGARATQSPARLDTKPSLLHSKKEHMNLFIVYKQIWRKFLSSLFQ